jgi:hypothetical protein
MKRLLVVVALVGLITAGTMGLCLVPVQHAQVHQLTANGGGPTPPIPPDWRNGGGPTPPIPPDWQNGGGPTPPIPPDWLS